MSRALDPRLVAEYRRKLSDSAYMARALAHVAGLLAEILMPARQTPLRELPRERDTLGDTTLYN